MNPIIVVGPPRSGTSCIARILQEKLGVMMDEGPISRGPENPNGYYEDHRLLTINKIALANWQHAAEYHKKVDREWAASFGQWVVMREIKFQKWGFKDPRMVGFLHWVFCFFKDPIWIYPVRRDEQILNSQKRNVVADEKYLKMGLKAYKKLIAKYLGDKVHKINMRDYRSEKSLTKELTGVINGCS